MSTIITDENVIEILSYCKKEPFIYEKNDILLGRDLLVFHETGKRALNMKNVDKYIQQYLV